MATWPDLTDYHEALQFPQRSLGDPELQKAQIDKDRFGMPKPATGGNAVVYRATEGDDAWAVRCFLRPISDHASATRPSPAIWPKSASRRAPPSPIWATACASKGARFRS